MATVSQSIPLELFGVVHAREGESVGGRTVGCSDVPGAAFQQTTHFLKGDSTLHTIHCRADKKTDHFIKKAVSAYFNEEGFILRRDDAGGGDRSDVVASFVFPIVSLRGKGPEIVGALVEREDGGEIVFRTEAALVPGES
jgi:hypothetical protein